MNFSPLNAGTKPSHIETEVGMPLALFCLEGSPGSAFEFLDKQDAKLEASANGWSARIEFDDSMIIEFNFDREWCSAPNWPKQILGMSNHVSAFPMTDPRRKSVLELIRRFEFCIGIVTNPEIKFKNDPRADAITALAEFLNGIIFTPSSLLDARFRKFAASDGGIDQEAEIPTIESTSKFFSALPNDIDDINDPVLPTAERVAKRMYVLLATTARGMLDLNLSKSSKKTYRLDELHRWFEALAIAEELEPEEREIIYAPENGLDRQKAINSVWRIEGLAVLAWALGHADLPPYDQLVDAVELGNALSLFDIPMSQYKLAHPELRPVDELNCYDEQIWTLDWRMVDFRIRPESIDLEKIEFGWGRLHLSWARLIDGDLSLQGKPISKADKTLISKISSAAMERHIAMYWLFGQNALYSEVSSDT